MKTITPHRTVVTSFSSSSVQGNNDEYYNSGEYILSIASSSSGSSSTSTHPHTASSSSSEDCFIAAALSDKSIAFYDASLSSINGNGATMQRIERAHDGPISEIEFFPSSSSTSSTSLISAGQDGFVKVWDLRCRLNTGGSGSNLSKSSLSMRLALPNEKALCISLGYGGTLAAVGTDKARISFFDLRYASSTTNNDQCRSGALLASYVDAHTEEVTKVRFQTTMTSSSSATTKTSSVDRGKTILASASEDGLIAIHDPSQPTEDAALLSVLNIGIPTRNIGFFGPNYEGIYALTGSESMSVHHWDSGQRICDVGGGMGLRDVLSEAVVRLMGDNDDDNNMTRATMSDHDDDGNNIIEYLVGCTWAPQVPSSSSLSMPSSPMSSASSFPALHLLAGNSDGDGYLFQVDADRITPLMHLKGGHKGCIRDFSWMEYNNNGGNGGNGMNGRVLVTGGEDSRLCQWNVYGTTGVDGGGDSIHHRGSRGGEGGGPIMSGRGGRSNLDNSNDKHNGGSAVGRKGKKKFGSPY